VTNWLWNNCSLIIQHSNVHCSFWRSCKPVGVDHQEHFTVESESDNRLTMEIIKALQILKNSYQNSTFSILSSLTAPRCIDCGLGLWGYFRFRYKKIFLCFGYSTANSKSIHIRFSTKTWSEPCTESVHRFTQMGLSAQFTVQQKRVKNWIERNFDITK